MGGQRDLLHSLHVPFSPLSVFSLQMTAYMTGHLVRKMLSEIGFLSLASCLEHLLKIFSVLVFYTVYHYNNWCLPNIPAGVLQTGTEDNEENKKGRNSYNACNFYRNSALIFNWSCSTTPNCVIFSVRINGLPEVWQKISGMVKNNLQVLLVNSFPIWFLFEVYCLH